MTDSRPPLEKRWWPGWYVDRLHAVADDVDDSVWSVRALCGLLHVYPPTHKFMQSPWQSKRLAGGPPKCKHCLRITGEAP